MVGTTASISTALMRHIDPSRPFITTLPYGKDEPSPPRSIEEYARILGDIEMTMGVTVGPDAHVSGDVSGHGDHATRARRIARCDAERERIGADLAAPGRLIETDQAVHSGGRPAQAAGVPAVCFSGHD